MNDDTIWNYYLKHRTSKKVNVNWLKEMRSHIDEPSDMIDLHRLSQDQAYQLLLKSFQSLENSPVKSLLIITGKGKNGGVLREQVPRWLQEPPLSHYIKKVDQSDSDSGVFNVFLK